MLSAEMPWPQLFIQAIVLHPSIIPAGVKGMSSSQSKKLSMARQLACRHKLDRSVWLGQKTSAILCCLSCWRSLQVPRILLKQMMPQKFFELPGSVGEARLPKVSGLQVQLDCDRHQ